MADYNIDDMVIYGTNGVCRVSEIQQREMGEYYILRPVHNTRTTILVPLFNERLVSRIRTVPTAKQLESAIEKALNTKPEWIDDINTRKIVARETMERGDEFEILMLVRAFYQHKQESIENGKKTTMSDNTILKTASAHVRDEFSVVLNIEPDDVNEYLHSRAVK